MDEEPKVVVSPALVRDGPSDRELLLYIAGTLERLGPLIDTLEQAAPLFGAMATSGNGKPPSAFKTAMAAAKLARAKD